MDCGVHLCGGRPCDKSKAANVAFQVAKKAATASSDMSGKGTPAIPGTPAVPATEATPEVPATESTPLVPATAATPAVPATPRTPAVPGKSERPISASKCGAPLMTVLVQGNAACECTNKWDDEARNVPSDSSASGADSSGAYKEVVSSCQDYSDNFSDKINLCALDPMTGAAVHDPDFIDGCQLFCGRCGAIHDYDDSTRYGEAIQNIKPNDQMTTEMMRGNGEPTLGSAINALRPAGPPAGSPGPGRDDLNSAVSLDSYLEGIGLNADGSLYAANSDLLTKPNIPCVNWQGDIYGFEYKLEMGDCWPLAEAQCFDAYEMGMEDITTKPMDFVSCVFSASMGECHNNPLVQQGCQATCKLCSKPPEVSLVVYLFLYWLIAW